VRTRLCHALWFGIRSLGLGVLRGGTVYIEVPSIVPVQSYALPARLMRRSTVEFVSVGLG